MELWVWMWKETAIVCCQKMVKTSVVHVVPNAISIIALCEEPLGVGQCQFIHYPMPELPSPACIVFLLFYTIFLLSYLLYVCIKHAHYPCISLEG